MSTASPNTTSPSNPNPHNQPTPPPNSKKKMVSSHPANLRQLYSAHEHRLAGRTDQVFDLGLADVGRQPGYRDGRRNLEYPVWGFIRGKHYRHPDTLHHFIRRPRDMRYHPWHSTMTRGTERLVPGVDASYLTVVATVSPHVSCSVWASDATVTCLESWAPCRSIRAPSSLLFSSPEAGQDQKTTVHHALPTDVSCRRPRGDRLGQPRRRGQAREPHRLPRRRQHHGQDQQRP